MDRLSELFYKFSFDTYNDLVVMPDDEATDAAESAALTIKEVGGAIFGWLLPNPVTRQYRKVAVKNFGEVSIVRAAAFMCCFRVWRATVTRAEATKHESPTGFMTLAFKAFDDWKSQRAAWGIVETFEPPRRV